MPTDTFEMIRSASDTFGVWVFCCIVAVIIVPLILNRIFYSIPMLVYLNQKGEVKGRGILITFFETLLWIVVFVSVYLGLYLFSEEYFIATTTSFIAVSAWVIGVGFLIYHLFSFNRTIKRQFYYKTYMRYITPTAYEKYKDFAKELDKKNYIELSDLLEQTDLPYMYRQTVLKKQRETRMVELLSMQEAGSLDKAELQKIACG